ncbi:MAG: response regulator, partial [Candidatus Sericytochromatia bacterium]
ILDFSKIEARKISLEKIDFSLKSAIFRVKEMFKAREKSKNIDLIVEYDEKIPDILEGDPKRLSQIINNLVSNSIKFTESGYVKITCKLDRLFDNKADIYFSIEDTGIGISKDRIDTIFEIFTQENTSTTRKYGGTGLGLNIVKSLLSLYNSEIKVESEKSKGSKFYFNLVLDCKNEKLENIEKKATILDKNLSGFHILIVEDNKINAIVAKQFLKKWNAECDIAEDGIQALDFLKEKATNLILMDIQMPNMDGLDATKVIRSYKEDKYKNLPIIALTAATTMDILDKVYEVGMNDYVSKPFNPDTLYLKIIEQLKK